MKHHAAAAFIFLVVVSAAASVHAQSQMDEKIRLEQLMASEVSVVLDKFLGPGKSHVTIMLGLDVKPVNNATGKAVGDKKDAPPEQPGKKKPTLQTKWLWQDISRKSKMTVLPGFSIAPEVTVNDDRKNEPKPKDPRETKPEEPKAVNETVYVMEINKIIASVVLDQSIKQEHVTVVKGMIAEMLALDPDRGDLLNVYTLPLLPAWQRMLFSPDSIGHIAWAVMWVVIAALFLWLLTVCVMAVLRTLGILPLKKNITMTNETKGGKSDKKDGKKDDKKDGKAGELDADGKKAEGKKEEEDPKATTPRYFEFINKDNAALLGELLCNCERQEAANVIGFLEPAVAAHVLANLKPEYRLEIIWCLSWAKSLPPEMHQEIHDAWKIRMEHSFGGIDTAGSLLSDLPPEQQGAFLKKMTTMAPDMAHKIKRSILRFEDLFGLGDAHLAELAQAVTFQEWAGALSGLPTAYVERLMSVLPQASRPMLSQWLALTSPQNTQAGPLRAKITKHARAMALEGRIVLPRGTSTPADTASEPANPQLSTPSQI